MMKTLVRLLATVAIVLGMFTAGAGSAQAASNGWSFNGSCCIYIPGGDSGTGFNHTREANITFTVSNWSPCSVGGSNVRMSVKLYKNDTFNNEVGNTKYITCTGTVSWSQVNAGRYYFYLRVDGKYDLTGSGGKYNASGSYTYAG